MNIETWHSPKDCEGIFEVSSLGRIRSVDRDIHCPLNGSRRMRGRLLSPSPMKTGYLSVDYSEKGKRKVLYVHRLVAGVFCANPNGWPHVNHIDGNKENNHPDNLEWCTHKQNMQHAMRNRLTQQTPVVAISASGNGYWFPRVNDVVSLGFQPSCVSNVINGIRRHHRGFTWLAA